MFSIKRWFYNQKITTLTTLTLVITLLISIAASGYFLFSFQRKAYQEELHKDHARITSMLAKSFKLPLEFYPKLVADGIIESFSLDERIVEVSIWDERKSEMFIHALFPERIKGEIFSQTRPIIVDNRHVGEVSVKISSNQMHQQINALFQANIMHFLIQFIISLVLILCIFYIKFSRPIQRLLNFINTLGDYHIATSSAWRYRDEIGQIGRAFEKAKQTITHSAMTDPQTGIHNHYMLSKILQNFFHHREQRNFAIIIIDIMNFNQINDQYGHLQGDALLLMLTQDIIRFKNPQHHLGRWAGNTLMIICPNETVKSAESFAFNLSSHIERTLYGDKINLQCAFGVAQTIPKDKTISDLLRRGFAMLKEAKKRPFGNVYVQQKEGV
jgi:diguanylate cyclase (GGDEF)-like protein